MSTALTLLKHLWEHGMKDSWSRINNSMRAGTHLAINSGLEFEASDFEIVYAHPRDGGFNGGYWMGSEDEWVYSLAIETGNTTAYMAWEEFKKRKPFFANNVEGSYYSRTFLHTSQMQSQRCRLAEGFTFPLDGRRWHVTGFDDEAGIVRAALYETDQSSGRPKKLRKFTHEQIAELFPAPKKVKAKKAA